MVNPRLAPFLIEALFHTSMKKKMDTLEASNTELDAKLAAVPAEDPTIYLTNTIKT